MQLLLDDIGAFVNFVIAVVVVALGLIGLSIYLVWRYGGRHRVYYTVGILLFWIGLVWLILRSISES